MSHLLRLLLLFIPFYSFVFSTEVILYDSTTVSTDLNWLTSTTHKHDVLGWYEESWTGQDKTSNIRVYSSCPDWSANFPLSNGSNWLIADPIKMETARGIYFNMMYVVSKCQMQNTACKETVNIHIKEYDHLRDVRNLEDFNPDSPSFSEDWKRHKVLTIEGKDLDQTTFSMKLKESTKQIRVAFDDNTACTSILSLKVYYAICEKVVHNYTVFDSTISQGASTDNNVMVKGKCIEHAVSQNSDEPVAFCGPAGQWTKHIVGGCECLPGFEAARQKGQQICRACPVGFFKPDRGSQSCEQCPPNSLSSKEGQAHCVCKRGFYRTVNESATASCTQPPTRPKDVLVKYVDETSAEIHWSESAYNGGRMKIWYEWECVRGDCSQIKANPSDKKLYSRVLQLSGLQPGSEYMLNIHAKNDVSELAGENGASYWPIDVHTKEPSKAIVRNLRIIDEKMNEIRLGWDIDGHAKEFEVEIESNEHGVKRDKLLTSVPGYTAANLIPSVRYTFKVRAKSHEKWTAWSGPLIYENGKGIAVMVDTSDSIESHQGNSPWYMNIVYILIGLSFVTLLILFTAYCICRSDQRNRKQMSDLDALDTYKQDTMTPDYGSGHRQFHDKFTQQKLNAPLISYGTPVSQPPPYYGGNGTSRFKPYVDPSTYDDPNQALAEFTLEIPPEAVYITTIIGGGEFGDVCMGNLRKSVLDSRYAGFDELETVAIKTLKPGSSGKAKMDFLLEASIMGQFAHPNVIRLIGVVTKSEPAMIVTEYMENGSLDHFLRDKDARGIVLSWRSLVDMLRGIAAGMKYLTDKGYVHRDLAARNVLIDSSYLCKIADFGLSRGVDVTTADAEYTTTGGKIPVRWTAPEAITHRKFTAASDVWSFGVLMWEVCSFGERPYWDWTNQKVITEIMSDYRLPAPMDCPQSLHRLMLWCWKLERHDRPTFTQLLSILEKYTRNPDMIYADSNLTARFTQSVNNVGIYNMTLPRNTAPNTPCPPPPSGSPPIYPQLDDFLKSLGLQHTREKLCSHGVNTVGELARRNHLDLLAMGLISEEYQRIRDALHQLQLSRGLGRPTTISTVGSQPRLTTGPAICQDEGFFV